MKKNTHTFLPFIVAGILFFLAIGTASASFLNMLSDSMSSIKVGNLSNHEIIFVTPSGVQPGGTIVLIFPSGFSIPAGLTFADIDINIGGEYVGSSTLALVPSGATLGVARTAANVLTITNGATIIPAGTSIYIKIGTNATYQILGSFQITNDVTSGNKPIGITGNFGDYGTTTVGLISDDTVQITAVVSQAFTFSISANSIDFGTLSTVYPKYASSTNTGGDITDTEAHNLTIVTNANSGYTITLQGPTLTSQQNPLNTISPNGGIPTVSSPGSEQFGMYATKTGGGIGVIDPAYDTISSFGYNATATTTVSFATAPSATGVVEVYHLHYIANISTLTEAGSYSAHIVYVGTSNF